MQGCTELVFEAAAVDGNRHAGTHGRVGDVAYAVPTRYLRNPNWVSGGGCVNARLGPAPHLRRRGWDEIQTETGQFSY